MTKRKIGAVCGTALLIAAVVVVAMRERRQAVPPPEAPVAQAPAEVRVKAVERNVETLDFSNAEAAKGATRYLCSAKRRCIVYVVMFCASRDRESWQGVASLGLLRLCFAKLLASLSPHCVRRVCPNRMSISLRYSSFRY